MGAPAGVPSTPRAKTPRTVWALGFVSLFMDVSSEMIHALLRVFLTGVLGVSVAMVGLIDGVAESTASTGSAAASPSFCSAMDWAR